VQALVNVQVFGVVLEYPVLQVHVKSWSPLTQVPDLHAPAKQ
jgi:hypothetical protein